VESDLIAFVTTPLKGAETVGVVSYPSDKGTMLEKGGGSRTSVVNDKTIQIDKVRYLSIFAVSIYIDALPSFSIQMISVGYPGSGCHVIPLVYSPLGLSGGFPPDHPHHHL